MKKFSILRAGSLALALCILLSLASCDLFTTSPEDTDPSTKGDDTTTAPPADDTTGSGDGDDTTDSTPPPADETTAPTVPTPAQMDAFELLIYSNSLKYDSYSLLTSICTTVRSGNTETSVKSGSAFAQNGDEASLEEFIEGELTRAFYLTGGTLYLYGKHGDYRQKNATAATLEAVLGDDELFALEGLEGGVVEKTDSSLIVRFDSLSEESHQAYLGLIGFTAPDSTLSDFLLEATLDTDGNLKNLTMTMTFSTKVDGTPYSATLDASLEQEIASGSLPVKSPSDPEEYLLVPSIADIVQLEAVLDRYSALLDNEYELMFTVDELSSMTAGGTTSTATSQVRYSYSGTTAGIVSRKVTSAFEQSQTAYFNGSQYLSTLNGSPVAPVKGVDSSAIYFMLYQGLYGVYLSPVYYDEFASYMKNNDGSATFTFKLGDEAIDSFAVALLLEYDISPESPPVANASISTISLTVSPEGSLCDIGVNVELDVTLDNNSYSFSINQALRISYDEIIIDELIYVAG